MYLSTIFLIFFPLFRGKLGDLLLSFFLQCFRESIFFAHRSIKWCTTCIKDSSILLKKEESAIFSCFLRKRCSYQKNELLVFFLDRFLSSLAVGKKVISPHSLFPSLICLSVSKDLICRLVVCVGNDWRRGTFRPFLPPKGVLHVCGGEGRPKT